MIRRTRKRILRVLTWRGWLPVEVCGLCAAVIVAVGVAQHERMHRADVTRER